MPSPSPGRTVNFDVRAGVKMWVSGCTPHCRARHFSVVHQGAFPSQSHQTRHGSLTQHTHMEGWEQVHDMCKVRVAGVHACVSSVLLNGAEVRSNTATVWLQWTVHKVNGFYSARNVLCNENWAAMAYVLALQRNIFVHSVWVGLLWGRSVRV